jgi:hypothetical protein
MKPFRRATDLLALFAIVIAGQGSAQLMTQFSSGATFQVCALRTVMNSKIIMLTRPVGCSR